MGAVYIILIINLCQRRILSKTTPDRIKIDKFIEKIFCSVWDTINYIISSIGIKTSNKSRQNKYPNLSYHKSNGIYGNKLFLFFI